MEATRPGVQALAEVFACGMLTGVLKGASTPWSAATASSVHFPARLPFPGQHGPSGLRERRPTDTAVTSPGSPCAWRPSSSDGSSRTRSGVQAAAWLWAQPGSGAGPAPGGVDTAPSRPTPLTVQSGRPPRSLAHAAVRPAPPSPARARACGAQGEASWPRFQGTSAVSGRSTRCSGGGLALAPCGSLPSALRPALGAAQPPQPEEAGSQQCRLLTRDRRARCLFILCQNNPPFTQTTVRVFSLKRTGSHSHQIQRCVQWPEDQGPPGGREQACWVGGLQCPRWARGTGAAGG